MSIRALSGKCAFVNRLMEAVNMKWRDFEDAVQSAAASRIHADYIITRNTKDFQDSPIPAITPEEYFANIFSPQN